MAEEQHGGRPTVWAQALRLLRGEDTAALMERFTQEVTLVAERLCEDQARLRRTVDGLTSRAQGDQERLAETLRTFEMRLTELSGRVAEIERKRQRRRLWRRGSPGRAARAMGLLCGAALLVAVLRLFG